MKNIPLVMSDIQNSFVNTVKMKETEKEQKQTNRRKTLNRLRSGSGLLLSVFCCVALIHQELRIQENHQMKSFEKYSRILEDGTV